MLTLRPYQTAAIEAVRSFWDQGGGNPLVDLATGTGKSLVIAKLTLDLLSTYPDLRVLMLVHVRELVAQNYQELIRLWPSAPAGIYSAGLGKRDAHHRITFASIQSVFRKARVLGRRDLVLIDEAHLVPTAGNGMYRQLLNELGELPDADMRVCGFTATPYRLDSGRLDAGADRLFDETVFSYGIGEGIADGYLSPLISKASAAEIDVSNVQRRGGEFVAGSLEIAALDDDLVAKAVDETIRFGADRRSWLMFCSGVKHATKVRDVMRSRGIPAAMVCGETPSGERDAIIRAFKEGTLRCLTNANVLTVGFNVPATDLVAMLRPTLSTSLFVQIVGRGTRQAHGKNNCLVLDFAGNVRRHGPVDAVSVSPKSGKAGEGKTTVEAVKAKECPTCEALVAINASSCPHCGHLWPQTEKPKHEAEADATSGILSTEPVKPAQLPVVQWTFQSWEKPGSPDSVRVDIIAGISRYSEWICPEHGGYAGQKSAEWWALHNGMTPFPSSVEDFLARTTELTMPTTIVVRPDGKFSKIVSRYVEKPDRVTLTLVPGRDCEART